MNTDIDKLVDLLDEAARLEVVEETVDTIKAGLCRLIRSGQVQLPDQFRQPVEGHYARRLLHRDDALGYSVVVMTWGPGQQTPVHDHSGMWCVEGVWEGSIDVEQYELMEKKQDRYRLEKRNSYRAGVGSAGCLIPPYEYHRIRNPDDREIAVSIHIYGGDMNSCNVFDHVGDDWYECCPRELPLF